MDYFAILVPLMTLLFTQAFACTLARFRSSKNTIFIILGVEIGIIAFISTLLLIFGGLQVYATWYVPIMVIPTLVTFLYLSDRRDARDLFTIVTTIFLHFSISIPAIWFAHWYGKGYLSYTIARLMLFFFLSIGFFVNTILWYRISLIRGG